MKTSLLAVSLAAGIATLAAPATAQMSGHIGASYGNSEIELGGIDADADVIEVDGSLFAPVGSGLVMQGDLSFSQLDDDVDEATLTAGGVHLGFRNAQWALGGYIAGTKNDNSDGKGIFYGGEFLYYFPQFTVSLGGGLGQLEDTFVPVDLDTSGISAEGRFFVTDNLRISGNIGRMSIEPDGGGGDIDFMGYGASIEFKPDRFPVSIFGAWEATDMDDIDLEVNTLSIGVRFDFGNSTLKSRDRNGATFRSNPGLVRDIARVL